MLHIINNERGEFGEGSEYKEKKMEPFTKEAKCPKCGYAIISIKYHKGSTYVRTCPVDFSYGIGEHLDRTCDQCGFSWVEETLT